MISSKKINGITAVLVCIALFVSGFMIFYPDKKTEELYLKNNEPEYTKKVFGQDIIDIKIMADQEQWDSMLQNATSEEYTMADVIINGEKISDVGIRVKGNSSLTQVRNTTSALRYSFRIKFDKYIKKQKFCGLDSLCLNNILADNTYMKEYISHDIMKYIGVDCPLYGYANITVNDKAWGFYLAIEAYNDSFLKRTYGDSSGELYNVKNEQLNVNIDKTSDTSGNNAIMPDKGMPDNNKGSSGAGKPGNSTGTSSKENTNSDTGTSDTNQIGNNAGAPAGIPGEKGMKQGQGMPGNKNGSFPAGVTAPGGMGSTSKSGGSNLVYTDDDPDSYSNIFDNVIGKSSKESDYKRVIKAIKKLNEGKNLEKYFDVDQILRYLAAHTAVVNLDSYSSGMCQNYVLYEKDGRVTILPWDYSLAFGGMNSSNASEVINFPIDTPVSGVEMSDRPLIEKLFENKEYLEKYHKYLKEIVEGYFSGGKFEAKVNKIDSLINEYVKNDASRFITYEEYTKAVEAFKTLGNLRAQSIQGQLDKTVPSTASGQKNNPDKLISAGYLNLSDLGTMGGRNGQKAAGDGSSAMNSAGAGKAADMQPKGTQGMGPAPNASAAADDTEYKNKKGIFMIAGLFALSVAAVFAVSKIKRRF